MAQTILYYPTINIQDGAWLRSAILYWDELSSIVPFENYMDFSPELLYLKELGVYKAIYPQELFCSEFSKDFCDCIVKRISAYSCSSNHRIHKECMSIHKKIYSPELYELIHHRKLPQQIADYFRNERFVNDCTGGWMEIDSKIAQIYMRTLAEYSIKCSDKDIVLGTDSVQHNREIYGFSCRREDLQSQCCRINIENCMPQPSMDVSIEDILDFKNRRKDELNAFRSKNRELETNIYNADSREAIRHYETQFTEEWQQCSRDFYKVLKDSRIKFLLSGFVSLVGMPFVGKQLSSCIGRDITSAIQTGTQLVNIGISYFDYKNKISPAKSEGGFSYIIKANRDGMVHI